jgi:sterol desaturase/sphingolipid hydroxylase (fatty acid hydroxylase superfamily)
LRAAARRRRPWDVDSVVDLIAPFDLLIPPTVGALLVGLLWAERHEPLRPWTQSRRERLATNAAMAGLATLVMRVALLPAVLGMAGWAERHELGLMQMAPGPGLARAALAFLLMDYTTYLWHRLNHVIPFLWRFHGVHHTDLDLDVSTAFRFHFGELLLSVGTRALQITIIGVGPMLVLAWEAVELAATAFHHSNLRLPIRLERALNRVLVTPRMHGIHHSIVERETNSNWSVVFSWWDQAHRTVRLNVPQEAITIGVPAYRDEAELRVVSLLLMPLRAQRPTWALPSGRRPERFVPGDPRRLAA